MPPLLPPTAGESTLPLIKMVDITPPLPKEDADQKICSAEVVLPVKKEEKEGKDHLLSTGVPLWMFN